MGPREQLVSIRLYSEVPSGCVWDPGGRSDGTVVGDSNALIWVLQLQLKLTGNM